MPQGDDVVVTENELYNYDGARPSHAINALFVGGIPETPSSPGYIPHFTTESGEGYAKIIDSTRSKDRLKERPVLSSFKPPNKSHEVDARIDTTLPLSAELQNEETDSFTDSDCEFHDGIDNPGYDPTLFGKADGKVTRDKQESSPYDYIDHNKLKRDDEEFEKSKDADYLTHPKTVDGESDELHGKRYSTFITRDTDPPVDSDGYLRSPTRNEVFVFPDVDKA